MTGMSHQCHSALRAKARTKRKQDRVRGGESVSETVETTVRMSCDGCDKVSFRLFLPLPFSCLRLSSLLTSLEKSAFFHGFRFCFALLVRENYKRITNIFFSDFLFFYSLCFFFYFLFTHSSTFFVTNFRVRFVFFFFSLHILSSSLSSVYVLLL